MSMLFFRRSFWGVILIVIGSVWLIENIFDLDIPLFRIMVSLALILIGIALIRGFRWNGGRGSQTIFAEGTYVFGTTDAGHSVMFGEVNIDLTTLTDYPETPVQLRCMFGEMRVKVPANVNLEIRGEVSFGSLQMPDGSSLSFGSRDYRNPLKAEGLPVLKVNISCAFGNVVVILA